MRDIEIYNNIIDNELPNNDATLQEILDYSFNQYQNHEDSMDFLDEDIDTNVDRIYSTAATTNITNPQIDNIFNNPHLKIDECSICINNSKLAKCYHCVGHICKLCTTKIYKRGYNNLKCPFCNQNLDLAQLDIHNRNIYSSKKQQLQPKQSKQSNSYHNVIIGEGCNIEEKNMAYAAENLEIYSYSDYNSGSSDIETMAYDDSKDSDYLYLEPKVGFTTSLYGVDSIIIEPFNKNRKKIIFDKKLYNCKYLLILYLILVRIKCNTLWNNFAIRFFNQTNTEKFKSSNYRKRFLWNTYLDMLCD